MLDDLRENSESFDFLDEEQDETSGYNYADVPTAPQKNFLGMTAVQRFVLATMLLFAVIILGTLLLLVAEKIVPVFG